MKRALISLGTLFLFAAGCGGSAATDGGTDLALGGGGDAGAGKDGGGGAAFGPTCVGMKCANPPADKCMHKETDYEPRACGSSGDPWCRCVSDDNLFHGVAMGEPAAAARARAFEDIATLLWRNPNSPAGKDFMAARDKFTVAEGIGSRVARRQDVHYPEIPGDKKLSCSEMATAMMYPDRCFSPTKLLPLIEDAFTKGIAGTEPRVQAARLEAALLWFFYLSPLSEVWTCSFDDIEDCDAVHGYYTGYTARDKPLGLAAYVNGLSPETHNRIYDAILGERCWRDLDRDLPAKNPMLYKLALDQLDRALTQGMALILKDRAKRIAGATGEAQKAQLTFVNLLGGWLDRAARAVDPAKADALKAQVSAADPAKVDTKKVDDAIDSLFPCP